ncbi:MAG: hypothetical protein AAGC74_11685 [Verrucomicrobiota bacterium]
MKTALFNLLALLALLASGHGQLSLGSLDIPPTGSLEASPRLVRAGTFPNLDWEINHPEVIDVVTIPPTNEIIPKSDLTMKVRVLGSAVSDSRRYYDTQLWYKINGGWNWSFLFQGQHLEVDPGEVVLSRVVEENDVIQFGGRYYNRYWQTFFYSGTDTPNVLALKNGEAVPETHAPSYYQSTVESFLAPYLDENRRISIGPRDVILLFELTHTDTTHWGFDMQDLVVLVTFE